MQVCRENSKALSKRERQGPLRAENFPSLDISSTKLQLAYFMNLPDLEALGAMRPFGPWGPGAIYTPSPSQQPWKHVQNKRKLSPAWKSLWKELLAIRSIFHVLMPEDLRSGVRFPVGEAEGFTLNYTPSGAGLMKRKSWRAHPLT